MRLFITAFFVLSAICLNAQEKPKKDAASTAKTKKEDSCCSDKSANKSDHSTTANVTSTATCHEEKGKKEGACCSTKTAKK